ncbi:MAG: flagellar hook-associated protein FlgK [Phycisphaerae bacterium]|nr:flagellar hook-associated protein FlgK [Phycisphaerae bacterium]
MGDFSIGISGIYAAHSAMTTIGNNIANVATEGYHRQRVDLRPNDPEFGHGVYVGQGVSILEPDRLIDRFLETAMLKQTASGEQYVRELSVLKSIENTFNDMGGTGLSNTITEFYNTLRQLSSDPQNSVDQNSVVNQASVLASQFNTIGSYLDEVEDQIQMEAENLVEEINSLSASVAEMNMQLQDLEVKGTEGSNLRDKRDKAITDIAKLIGVTTQTVGNGALVNVFVGGFPIVMGTVSTNLEVSSVSDSMLGVSPEGVKNYDTSIRGGKLGGLIATKNEHLSPLKSEFDALALDIITAINKFHVQGVPSYNKDTSMGGSFTSLDGWAVLSDDLSEINPPISDGTINVRITDTATGVIRRYSIDVESATDTMTSMAAKFDTIDGLSSSINNSFLHIEADAGYKFDFIPSPLPVSPPTLFSSTLSGSSVPSVDGIYTGSGNQNYTMTIVGNATVGVDAFDVQVQDEAVPPNVTTINVAAGYVPGDPITTVDGIEISFAAGTVVDAETFTVAALDSPLVSGVFTGDADETYTCTVVGTGSVGVTNNLSLQIENSAGQLVNTINIGSGYVPSSTFILDTSQGIKLQMDTGDLEDGQTFEIRGLADSDTSDFLAVTGINSFFMGHNATSMSVNEKIKESPSLISVSMGVGMADNENIKRISQLSEVSRENLGYMSHESYYRTIATGLAQKINVTSLNQENSENVLLELKSQRDKVSGVDINKEASELMIYEQMFQSMAKYLNLIKESMEEVMNIL